MFTEFCQTLLLDLATLIYHRISKTKCITQKMMIKNVFLYSVVAGLLAIDDNKINHLDRQSTIMKHCDKYNLKIDENMYPIPVDNNVYRSIEKHNDFSFSVYGFQYDDKDEKYTRYQIYQTSGKKKNTLMYYTLRMKTMDIIP